MVFTFGFGIFSTLAWIKYNKPIPNDKNEDEDLPILAYCELVKNPEKYSGKIVRVSADLYWFMHGYYLADKNCAAGGDSARTAIVFDNQNRDRIFQKFNEIRGKETLDYRDVINMIAVGKFKKVEKSQISSDSIKDRTLLHFEIKDIESAYLYVQE